MEWWDKLVNCPKGAIQIKSVSNSRFLNEVERLGHPIVVEVDVIKKGIGELGRVMPTFIKSISLRVIHFRGLLIECSVSPECVSVGQDGIWGPQATFGLLNLLGNLLRPDVEERIGELHACPVHVNQ
jgi:hypothetical protein